MKERLLTPEEAAERLSVSAKGVKNWLRQGRLKGFKVGRLWRISETDLQAFLQGPMDAGDRAWLEEDGSGLGQFEPYDWGPQGPPSHRPVRYVEGQGAVVEGGS